MMAQLLRVLFCMTDDVPRRSQFRAFTGGRTLRLSPILLRRLCQPRMGFRYEPSGLALGVPSKFNPYPPFAQARAVIPLL